MERVTGRVPNKYMKELNRFVEEGVFPSVSEAIRYALNNLIDERVLKIVKKSYHGKS